MIEQRTSRWAFSPIRLVYRPVCGLFWRRRKIRTKAKETVVDSKQFGKIKVLVLRTRSIKGTSFSVKIGREFKDGPMGLANRFYDSDAHDLASAVWWTVDWFIHNGNCSQRQLVFLQCLDEGLAGIDTVFHEFERRCKKYDRHNSPN